MKAWIIYIKKTILVHKAIFAAAFVVLLGAGYYAYHVSMGASAATRYVLGEVTRNTLVASVSGSGQVSASNQVDVHPKVSGQIAGVYAKVGRVVKEGAVLAYIDSSDAQNAVRDAELNLESAKLALERTTQDSAASALQADNALASAQDSQIAAESSVEDAHQNSFTSVSDAFLEMPGVISGLDAILNDGNPSSYMADDQIRNYATNRALEYKYEAVKDFYDAKDDSYEAALEAYRSADGKASADQMANLLLKTRTAAQALADAVRETNTLLEYLKNQGASGAQIDADSASITGYASTMNGTLTKLRSAADAVAGAERDLANANRTLEEKKQAKSGSGSLTEPLDVRSATITLEQRQNTLQKAQEELAKYAVRAPFSGAVGAVGARVGDEASGSTVVATITSPQKIAVISLNEVDVVKVAEGQKATLTFDALPELSLTGKVLEVSGVGTANQGVVTYEVKIGFDTGDGKVKPGMSVSVSIITESHPDSLVIPSSAVHSSNGFATVQVISQASAPAADGSVTADSQPESVPVEVGVSNDTDTEILSGLVEGDMVVVRTLSGSAQAGTQRQQANTFLTTGRTAGGGAVRAGAGFTGGH